MEVWKGVLLIHSTDIHWQRPPPRGDREAACGGSMSHLFSVCTPGATAKGHVAYPTLDSAQAGVVWP